MITPDPPSLSPSESSASINPAQPKLARIGTKVVRDAFLSASSKHPPKPTPALGRESSPAVGGLSDGNSDEQGGSAEPKTGGGTEGETVEEKQRRQKQEANRKSAEKRRKRKEEEKERLKLLEANGELPAEAAQNKDDSPSLGVAPGATEGVASPSSSSEDRPIGALGGSSVNLATLGKGGTPPIGARAGSVPPAKKAPAKKATSKAAAPAGGAKKAPKPKGEWMRHTVLLDAFRIY